MPFADKNAAPTGARITAKNEYSATAFTLFNRGTPWKQYRRQKALVRTWTVLAGINQAIPLIGTPTSSLLNSPDLRFVARDGIRASKDGRAGGLRGLLGTKLRWDQRKDSFTQGSARNAGGS